MNIFIILSLVSLSTQNFINQGVYIIMTNNNYLQYNRSKILISKYDKYPNTYFRINKSNKFKNNYFYYIEEIFTSRKLSFGKNKELIMSKKNDNNNLWKFIKLKNKNYIIIKENKCFIKINKFNVVCKNMKINEAAQFNLMKIFEEIMHISYNIKKYS